LHSENLPSVSYRISADYGRVEVATSTSSKGEDLFGSTMNICAKINSMAEPNGIVIGGDLYRIINSFSFIIDKYQFRELEGGYSIGFGNRYPLYTAALSNDTHGIDINRINQLFGSDQTPRIKDVRTKQQSQQLQRQQQKYSANIMVIDDEPDILFTYECFLTDEGYNVEAFADPQEALKHFVQLSGAFSSYYQLVLLDIRMPRLNGLQLYNTIKTLSPNTKIMFVSALDMAEELTSILPNMKYSDIIRKPVEREYFIRKINSMLNN
jgi:CheY-like chemotaxis protein